MAGPGTIFFADAAPDDPLSYEGLQTRRKIAESMIARGQGAQPYPKTLGEGLTAWGRAYGESQRLKELDRQDAAYRAAQKTNADAGANYPRPGVTSYDQQQTAATPAPTDTTPPPTQTAAAPAAMPPGWGDQYINGAVAPGVNEATAASQPAGPPMQTADAGGGGDAGAPTTVAPPPPAPDVLPQAGAAPYTVAATPQQKLAARDQLIRTMMANPRGTLMGGGAAPVVPFSAVAAPGGDNPLTAMAQAAPDEGNPAIITNIPAATDTVTYRERPTPPRVLQPSREERVAIAKLMANPTDPNNVAVWKPVVDAYAADRAAQYQLQKENYDKLMADYVQGGRGGVEYRKDQRGEAERQLKIRQDQLKIPTSVAQGIAGADPYLNTPQSQQRKGYPDIGPIPAGVIEGDFRQARQKEMQADVQQADKADLAVPQALQVIHDLRNHAGKEKALGFVGPAAAGLRGTDARDFVELVNRANGGLFLNAYQAIRGSGQISNVEGQKAEQALANLSTAQSKQQFDKALDDYEQSIRRGFEVTQRKVNRPVTAYRALNDNTTTAPDIGHTKDGYQYLGGPPANPMSWRKL